MEDYHSSDAFGGASQEDYLGGLFDKKEDSHSIVRGKRFIRDSLGHYATFFLCHIQMSYATQLATEAVVVGVALIPLFLLVNSQIRNQSAALFVSGAAFHLLCEVSGLNKWYLSNGASSMNSNV